MAARSTDFLPTGAARRAATLAGSASCCVICSPTVRCVLIGGPLTAAPLLHPSQNHLCVIHASQNFLLRITRSSAYAVTVLVITVARFGGRDSSTPASAITISSRGR